MQEQSNKAISPQNLFAHAMQLYKNAENKDLEKLFARFLKKSYDIDFWNLYIEYVKKISTKKVNLIDVYAFVCTHFEGSYIAYDFIREYINELEASDEDNAKADQIRKIYHRSFVPMHNLGALWSEYEKWEMKINRHTAKTFIEQIHPIYTLSSNTYQRLLPYIESSMFFKIFDIELENPLKLQKKDFENRLAFLFGFYLSKYPNSEQLCFLFSFYLKEIAKERLDMKTNNVFLSLWYSFQYNTSYFNFTDNGNSDLVFINYLNWISKNEGIEMMRQKFSESKQRVGPHVFVYVANAEFYQGGSKEAAYQIFTEGVEKYKDNPIVNEQFFQMFLKIGDDDNIRLLFKKLKKTEKMWDLMAEYEFLHGELNDYKNILAQKQVELNTNQLLQSTFSSVARSKSRGCQAIFESVMESFGYLDLQIATNGVIKDFISKLPILPKAENIFSNIDNFKIIDLLASLPS